MPQILISYRREDSIDVTGRIYDRLVAHFDKESVFMDVDTIPLGVDFRTYLTQWVARADALLVVMGDRWLDARYAEGPRTGERRLGEPEDYVTIEITAALRRGIPVVPLLVGNMAIPTLRELPESLSELAYRNAAEVRSGRDFHTHMDRLIRDLDAILSAAPTASERSHDIAQPESASSEVQYVFVEPPCVARPTNLGFEGPAVNGMPEGWFDSLFFVGGASTKYEVSVIPRDDAPSGQCVRMYRSGAHAREFGSVMQRFPAHRLVGKDIRLEADIRSESVGSWAGLWLRVDGQADHLFFDNMEDRPIRGTTPWAKYRIDGHIPERSEWLNYGFLLASDGTVWADDFQILLREPGGEWAPMDHGQTVVPSGPA